MENVFLIVGLGNPGAEYAQTRHNAGFLLVEKLAAKWKCDWANERKFKARIAKADRNGKKVLLCEPQTFMNLSGETVGALKDFYQLPLKQIDWWRWTTRICRWAKSGCAKAAAAVDIMVWNPSSSIWRRASLRDCGSGSGAKTVRARLQIMFSENLIRPRASC